MPFKRSEDRGFVAIGLEKPNKIPNIGSALRACACYGASMLAISGNQSFNINHIKTDTARSSRHIPVIRGELQDLIPYNAIPIAVDIIEGAIPLWDYVHPERAFYIFGPEAGTVNKKITSWCKDTIYVPTNYCMNLGVTVNVVLYDRLAKRYKDEYFSVKRSY